MKRLKDGKKRSKKAKNEVFWVENTVSLKHTKIQVHYQKMVNKTSFDIIGSQKLWVSVKISVSATYEGAKKLRKEQKMAPR